MAKFKGREIIGAKLHAFTFIGGSQVGPDLRTSGTTKAVDLSVEDGFLMITVKATKSTAATPLANVIQLELGPEESKK